MGAAAETILNQNESSIAALDDHCQIAPVPAQGRGAVGLMPVEMAQGQGTTAAEVLQLHRGSSPLIHDHGEFAAVAAQGRLLLLFGQKRTRCPLCSAAAPGDDQAGDQQ
jgi:hypothetical protein